MQGRLREGRSDALIGVLVPEYRRGEAQTVLDAVIRAESSKIRVNVLHLKGISRVILTNRPTTQGKEMAMHIQIVTYRIGNVSESDFVEANQEFAEMMAAVPGLVARVWLRGPDEDGYGGLYLWQDRDAYDNFLAGHLWAEVVSDESLLDFATHDFEVMDDLTRMTQPGLQLL